MGGSYKKYVKDTQRVGGAREGISLEKIPKNTVSLAKASLCGAAKKTETMYCVHCRHVMIHLGQNEQCWPKSWGS